MRRIRFPSAEVPAPPPFDLMLPEDWELLAVPGVVLAAAEPAVGGAFRANIVVTLQRHPAPYTESDARAAIERRIAGMPQVERLGEERVSTGGRAFLSIEYAYTPPQRGTVLQSVRCTVVERPSARAVDVIELVASCAAAAGEEGFAVLRALQDSWVLVEGPDTTA